MSLVERLQKIGACPAALYWVRTLPCDVSLTEAWERCERADWLLWLAGKAVREHGSPLHRQTVCAAAICASTVAHRIRDDDVRTDIEAVIAELVAWSEGAEIDLYGTRETAYTAHRGAYDAYAAYDAACAAVATYAACDASYTAYCTIYDTVARYAAAKDISEIVRTHVDVALVDAGLG